MPQKVLKFAGINRKVSEFSSAGACEELINIRPTETGLEIVRPKAVKFANTNYDVYNHAFGDKSLFVGILAAEGDDFVVYLIDDEGHTTEIDSFTDGKEEYNIAFVGNQMLLTTNEKLRVYAYKNSSYVRVDSGVPDDIEITCEVSSGYGYSQNTRVEAANPNKNSFKEEVLKQWSAALGQNSIAKDAFGPVLIAFNYSLADGTELWTNKWIYFNPFSRQESGNVGDQIFYTTYDEAVADADKDGTVGTFTFDSYAPVLTIKKKQFTVDGVESMIKSLNIYASRPIFPYNIDTMFSKTDYVHDFGIFAKTMSMQESEISKQLLYFQKSIPISDLESKDITNLTLDFREAQIGEKVLKIDEGATKRVGKIISHNNRAHFYDSNVTIYPQSVTCSSNVNHSIQERDAYVHLDCNGNVVVLKVKANVPIIPDVSGAVSYIYCIYPDARAKKMLVALPDSGYVVVNMQSSERYNYAWGEAKYYLTSYSPADIIETSNVINESNALNVSEPYNPFVFPVEYSYSFGGKIKDVTTSYLPISSTQISQYPLTVFTTSGIFALEQGNGAVLYGNITPLQPLVIEGKACPTPYGTFFTSSKSLYILNGRDVADVSAMLNGEMETNVRTTDAYSKLVCNGDGDLFDFTRYISNTDFEDFVGGAYLTYDQLNNELIISSRNSAIPYSYVFDIDTKAYHKINRRIYNGTTGARYVIEITNGRNTIDLQTENKGLQNILLQSRPMGLELLNTHIDRLTMLVDANLEGASEVLCLSVFGSDNLSDWKCIISAQKQGAVLRHIRTNRAARSYRDYIIVINGTVKTGTDIAEIIADYTIVNRRLG